MNIYEMPNGDIELADYPYRMDQDWCNVVWVITHQCNLGCPYCIGFKSEGRAESILDGHGSTAVLDALQGFSERSGKHLYLTISGGEPTLIPEFAKFCQAAIDRGFVIELQTNLLSRWVPEFLAQVDPTRVSQIMATYHGWQLDAKAAVADKYFENFRQAIDRGFTTILKTVVLPNEVAAFPAKKQQLITRLPKGVPILSWGFIRGHPRSQSDANGAYPYAYTAEQAAIMDAAAECRRGCQIAYRSGSGWYRGMLCDAGRGFVYLNVAGALHRCYSGESYGPMQLGHLFDGKAKMINTPEPCPVSFCGTAFWPLWYGVDPWNYIPSVNEEDAHYCRFGPCQTQE